MPSQPTRRLHESTSRSLCRLAFVVLGGLPLVFCVVVCLLQVFPAYRHYRLSGWRDRLEDVLELSVKVAGYQELSPGRVRLKGVEFGHPETGGMLAQFEALDVQRRERQWILTAEHCRVQAGQLRELANLLHDSLLCRPLQGSVQAAVLRFERVELQSASEVPSVPPRTDMLAGVEMRLLPVAVTSNASGRPAAGVPSGRQEESDVERVEPGQAGMDRSTFLEIKFSLDSPAALSASERGPPCVLSLQRFHQPKRLMTRAHVEVLGEPLPMALLSSFLPELKRLGAQATFEGQLNLHKTAEGWLFFTEEGCRLARVDFGELLWNSQLSLTGQGALEFSKVYLDPLGAGQVQGRIVVEQGQVSQQTLALLAQDLGVELHPGLQPVNQFGSVAFSQAACDFLYCPPALYFIGGLPHNGQAKGAIFANAKQSLAVRLDGQRPLESGQFENLLRGSPQLRAAGGIPFSDNH